jgi:hypothetical protein
MVATQPVALVATNRSRDTLAELTLAKASASLSISPRRARAGRHLAGEMLKQRRHPMTYINYNGSARRSPT